jgi:hypothetical protein
MLLPNGSAIKNDVIDSFNKAIDNPENQNANGTINWNFVDADLHIDMSLWYTTEYLNACFDVMVDEYNWLMTGVA